MYYEGKCLTISTFWNAHDFLILWFSWDFSTSLCPHRLRRVGWRRMKHVLRPPMKEAPWCILSVLWACTEQWGHCGWEEGCLLNETGNSADKHLGMHTLTPSWRQEKTPFRVLLGTGKGYCLYFKVLCYLLIQNPLSVVCVSFSHKKTLWTGHNMVHEGAYMKYTINPQGKRLKVLVLVIVAE